MYIILCVNMYACMYVCMYACMHAFMYVCQQAVLKSSHRHIDISIPDLAYVAVGERMASSLCLQLL